MPQTTFDQRVSKIYQRHRSLSEGASYRIDSDGLILAVPHRRFVPRFPGKGLLLLLGGAFAFKAALFIASGEATYNSRLAEMAQGRLVEQAMAWLMQPDPSTRVIAAGVQLAVHLTGPRLP